MLHFDWVESAVGLQNKIRTQKSTPIGADLLWSKIRNESAAESAPIHEDFCVWILFCGPTPLNVPLG